MYIITNTLVHHNQHTCINAKEIFRVVEELEEEKTSVNRVWALRDFRERCFFGG